MKRPVCIFMAVCMACAAHSLFAVGKGTDTKGEYWEDASGVNHYYLFQRAGSGNRWSIDQNLYSREAARDTSSTTVQWVQGSIFTLEAEASYSIGKFDCSPNAVMYGMEFEAFNGSSHVINFQGNPKYTIGEYGIHSISGNTLQFQKKSEGAVIHLAASQTWSGDDSATLSSAPFVIVPNYMYDASNRGFVTAEDGIVLTVVGDTVVAWLCNLTNDNPTVTAHPLTNVDMVVKSPAIVSVCSSDYGYANLNMRKVTIDGGIGIKFGADKSITPASGARSGASTYGIGSCPLISPVRIAEQIVLTNGATLTALEATTVTGGVRIVSAGMTANSLSGTFSLADSATVFRIEEGATLDLTGATFTGDGTYSVEGSGTVRLDAAQAAYATFGNFTGTIDATASRLFVLDDNVSGEVAVANGETLIVLGNGLGGNATLSLASGATVMFRRTATIFAPVSSTGTVYFRTSDNSVTGTVAGVYTDTSPSSGIIEFKSPGRLIFSGGGTWGRPQMRSGNVDITGAYTTVRSQFFYGGHMTIRDGGSLTVTANYCDTDLTNNTDKDVCLEIASGGSFSRTGNNCCTYIGAGSTAYESKLLVSGGSFTHNYNLFRFNKGGVIEVTGGNFTTKRTIECTSDTAEDANIVLKGGVFQFTGSANYCPMMFSGSGYCTMTVDGAATLRWTGTRNMPDTTSDVPQATWRCTAGSRLRFEGPNDNAASLTMHNFEADGLFFDFNTSDYNAYRVNVKIANPHDPVGVGFVLPGKSGSVVTAATDGDVAPGIVTSYVVPEGVTFNTASLPSGWYSGFGDVSISNLVFETGAALSFPFFGNASSLAISGLLTLPDAMTYSVDAVGAKRKADAESVIVPALGIAGNSACVFACVGGTNPERATLAAADGALRFSYKTKGVVISFR